MATLGSINARLLIEIPGGSEPVWLGDVSIPLKAGRKSSSDCDGKFVTYELACDLTEVKGFVQEVFKQSGGDDGDRE